MPDASCIIIVEGGGALLERLLALLGFLLILPDLFQGEGIRLGSEPHGLGIILGQPADPLLVPLLQEGENFIKFFGRKDEVSGILVLDPCRNDLPGLYPIPKGCPTYQPF